MRTSKKKTSTSQEIAVRNKAARDQVAREQHIPWDRLSSDQQEVRRAVRALDEAERTQAQREEQAWLDALPWELLNPAQRDLRLSAMAHTHGKQHPVERRVVAYATSASGGIGQQQVVTVYRTSRGLHINGDPVTSQQEMPNNDWWLVRTTGRNPDGSKQQTSWNFRNQVWLGLAGG